MHNHHSPISKKTGNLFLLIKKSNLPKLQKLNLLYKNNKSPNPKNPEINHNASKSKSQKFLMTESIPTNTQKHIVTKVYRKNSEVSIDQNLDHDEILDNSHRSPGYQSQYVIKISECPQTMNDKQQNSPQKPDNFSSIQQKDKFLDFWPQIRQKSENFKSFFQYILDFKMKKKNSYASHWPNFSLQTNKESKKITPKRLRNSLGFTFKENQTVQNRFVPQQNKLQVQGQNKLQLDNSQISIVDVRLSSASIDDFTPVFQKSSKKRSSSPGSQMRKSKKVYFDFQNPRFSQPECILQQQSPFIQSQNNMTIINRTTTRIVTLQQLKQRIQNQQENSKVTHNGFFCDECKVDPIVGRRYRCIECDEYDLCELCYKKQCDKYAKILKQYEIQRKLCGNEKFSADNSSFLFQVRPLMNKKMSDIAEEDVFSQKYSSEQNPLSESSKDPSEAKIRHVHLMEEVHKPKQTHQLNFDKILRETNRSSLRSINDRIFKKERQIQKTIKFPNPQSSRRQKLLNSIKMNKARLALSQKMIPLNLAHKSHGKILDSKRRQIQNIRKSTQSICSFMN